MSKRANRRLGVINQLIRSIIILLIAGIVSEGVYIYISGGSIDVTDTYNQNSAYRFGSPGFAIVQGLNLAMNHYLPLQPSTSSFRVRNRFFDLRVINGAEGILRNIVLFIGLTIIVVAIQKMMAMFGRVYRASRKKG